MSRVDDDHQARKLIEQLALKKANEQQRAQKQGESAFAQRLQTKPKEAQQPQEQRTTETRSLAQEAFERLRAQSGAGTSAPARQARQAPTGTLGQAMKQTEQHQQSTTQTQHQGAQLTRSEQGEVRRESHRDTSSRLDERGKSSMQSSERSGALAADGKAEALRTEGQGNNGGSGSGQQQGEGGGGQKDGGAAAGFRFNPALMAPVPVARPRETATSDRLRTLANEIAQKIVERVRVGTNAVGNAEFQIDLRSNVLSGLSIKVSSRNGRIDASFSGSNREVLALLEQNAESLRKTLSGRGLTLGDLSFKERA